MYSRIDERYEDSTPPFVSEDRWAKVNGEWRLLQEHADDLEDVEQEIGPFIEGEFVSVTLDWDIKKVKIDA